MASRRPGSGTWFHRDLDGDAAIISWRMMAQSPRGRYQFHVFGGHRQLVVDGIDEGAMGRVAAVDRCGYAAIAAPVTSAQAANAWLRAVRNLAAVSWSGRREKTLAI